MKISKYIHSCVLVEDNGERILIDPGPFSFIEGFVKPEIFQGISAILVTHKHTDHYDIGAIKTILKNNPGAVVYCNSEMSEVFKEQGIDSQIFEDGEKQIGSFSVKAFFAEHEPLPKGVPINTAFLINDLFLHPGDSFDPVIFKTKAKVLALPVAAPWMTIVKGYNFASEYKPEIAIPIHDGHIKDFFTEGQYKNWGNILQEKNIVFKPLMKAGESIET